MTTLPKPGEPANGESANGEPATDEPTNAIWTAIGGLSRFASLAAFADLGAADHMDGPLTPAELAARCGADAAGLARVLRVLAGMGIVASDGAGRYALTPSGETLRSDAPGSMLAAVKMNASPEFRYGYGHLGDTVREGRSAFVKEHGMIYDHVAARPELSRLFDDYMTARAIPHRRAVAALYDFSGVDTLVDVGGGKGHFLAAVMAANPHLRGTLFELPHVAEHARKYLPASVDVVTGDFFADPLPAGADAYFLASVLHNWSDGDAVRILRRIREAMPQDGRLLVLEYALPDEDRPHVGLDGDIRMLAMFDAGQERTHAEYGALFEAADLKLTSAQELPAGTTLMEARPTG
ncbi:acetylserotonin O-methyltransferase [Actinomadura rupiterrae]|uniref:acetylserotonin O-methyltransferase n=1 Tax=Actinomadura rupiterrae TaxID=559627 RepID=UPI0020A398A0|nr:acetylserotonin O-methyltransferase [Actinomadura rupiterrae]MCP2339007.1 SAM-dependent methyltransferase [Actinomadura rupiterrae]